LRLPDNDRYLYPSAVFIVLIAVELLYGVRLRRRGVLVGAVVVAIAVASNLVFLSDDYKLFWKPRSELIRADLTALETAGPSNPSFLLTQDVSAAPFFIIGAGSYLSAVSAWGSPAYTEPELASASESSRLEADKVLAAILGLKLAPGGATSTPCRTVDGSPTGLPGVRLGPGTTTLKASAGARAQVVLGRFSDELRVDAGPLRGGSTASITIPADRSDRPWRLGAKGKGTVRICGDGLS
jgi:hypothetical protein